MLKKILLRTLLFIAAATLYTVGWFLDKGLTEMKIYIDSQRFDSKAVQKTYLKREREINALLEKTAKHLQTNSYSSLYEQEEISEPKKPSKFHLNFTELTKRGIFIYVYHNDTLKLWSSNNITISDSIADPSLVGQAININNNFYSVHTSKLGNYTVLGLLQIRSWYPYENHFLPNSFHEDFDIPSSTIIYLAPEPGTQHFRNNKGEYVFSLMQMAYSFYEKPYYFESIGCYTISIILFFILFLILYLDAIRWKRSIWFTVIFTAAIVGFRYLMIKYGISSNYKTLELFSELLFSQSFWYPSLGDFFINSLLLFTLITFFVLPIKIAKHDLSKPKHLIFNLLFSAMALCIAGAYFYFIVYLTQSLLFNSEISFELYKFLELNFFSFVGIANITLLFGSFAILLHKIVKFISTRIKFHHFTMISVIVSILIVPTTYYFENQINIYILIFFAAIITIYSLITFCKIKVLYYIYVIIIFLFAVFIEYIIFDSSYDKEVAKKKTLVQNLITERDHVAEHLLIDIDSQLVKDDKLLRLLIDSNSRSSVLIEYLQKMYFHGYWNKYDLEVTICGNGKGYKEANNIQNCMGYFHDYSLRYGEEVIDSSYYFINERNGNISYLGNYHLFMPDSSSVIVFLKLNPKFVSEALGYPELLLDEKVDKFSPFSNYSYAKYMDGKLTAKSGTFPYNLTSETYNFNSEKYYFIAFDDYDHLIYNHNSNLKILLSKQSIRFLDLLTAFSYLFSFFILLVSAILLIKEIPKHFRKYRLNFENRLRFSMLFILILSFILVGGGTLYYNLQQSQARHYKNISDKLHSLQTQLKHEIGYHAELNTENTTSSFGNLNEMINWFAVTFLNDINLYDPKGNLLVSSRPEIKDRGLIGNKMNAEAYRLLSINKKVQVIQNEMIGEMSYTSAYMPFYNVDDRLLGYVNLPFFTQPSQLKNEISGFVVTIVNWYVILFLLATVLSVVMANKITAPLRFLQGEFRKIELGKKNLSISYPHNDEIGGLIKEHNRMVVELERSTQLLAKSERESAWQEMAKQVAHEIKNPLTPMKLSIQFLLRAWRAKDNEFGERIENVTETLIEQINTLTSIANAFSDFAKMPKANNEVIDIVQIVRNCVRLFDNTEGVSIQLDTANFDSLNIFADREQLSRVFVNLIKNGIQSIPDFTDGEIKVCLSQQKDNVIVTVKDNGTGIPDEIKEKIFRPNFTTKSSGMGLGLAMVKNTVEGANGQIWFETELGKGTQFYVEIPVFNEQ